MKIILTVVVINYVPICVITAKTDCPIAQNIQGNQITLPIQQ